MVDAPTVHWDGCTMEPWSLLRWLECHPGTGTWVQGILTVAAILAAIFVPIYVYRGQRADADLPRQRAINRVIGVLRTIRGSADALKKAATKYGVAIDGEGHTLLDSADSADVGAGMLAAYQSISDAAKILPDMIEKVDVSDANAVHALNAVSSALRDCETAIANEMRWLSKSPTKGVVNSSLGAGNYVAAEVIAPIDAAIAALVPDI